MKTKFSIDKLFKILIILIFFSFISCSPEYIPNVANTPMFDGQGELQANVSTGVSGADVQAAYALSDHLGVMVNTSFYNQTSDTSSDFHKHQIYEFGLGYYGNLSDYGRFEIYGGFGTGKIKGYNEDLTIFDNAVSDATFSKIFVQPSFGLKSKYFDGNLGARFAFVKVNYNNVQGVNSIFNPSLNLY